MEIQYVIGDATEPIGEEVKIIAHICNDVGAWGAGFTAAISKKWPKAESRYREWSNGATYIPIPFILGETIVVKVEKDIFVANMVAQHGLIGKDNSHPIDYNALRRCLGSMSSLANSFDGIYQYPFNLFPSSIHMPRIGTGLAGGKWENVESIIKDELTAKGRPVFVYDLPVDKTSVK